MLTAPSSTSSLVNGLRQTIEQLRYPLSMAAVRIRDLEPDRQRASPQWVLLTVLFLGAGAEDTPLRFVYPNVVNARLTTAHQPVLIELP